MERKYEYVVHVDGKEVWRGKDLKDRFWEFKKKNLGKKVSVAWESNDDIFI